MSKASKHWKSYMQRKGRKPQIIILRQQMFFKLLWLVPNTKCSLLTLAVISDTIAESFCTFVLILLMIFSAMSANLWVNICAVAARNTNAVWGGEKTQSPWFLRAIEKIDRFALYERISNSFRIPLRQCSQVSIQCLKHHHYAGQLCLSLGYPMLLCTICPIWMTAW